jgi:hypothetical protein
MLVFRLHAESPLDSSHRAFTEPLGRGMLSASVERNKIMSFEFSPVGHLLAAVLHDVKVGPRYARNNLLVRNFARA